MRKTYTLGSLVKEFTPIMLGKPVALENLYAVESPSEHLVEMGEWLIFESEGVLVGGVANLFLNGEAHIEPRFELTRDDLQGLLSRNPAL